MQLSLVFAVHPSPISKCSHVDTVAFLERERRETRRRLVACVRLSVTFRTRILTIVSQSVITTKLYRKTAHSLSKVV